MDSACAELDDFSFSRFGFIVRADRQTDRQTDRQRRMIAIFTLLYREYGNKKIHEHATLNMTSATTTHSCLPQLLWKRFFAKKKRQRL